MGGRGGEKDVGGTEEEETVIRVYWMGKILFLVRKKSR